MNPIENLIIMYKRELKIASVLMTSVFGPGLVDQVINLVTIYL